MKKTAIFGLFALMIVGMVFSTSMVSAYRGDYSVEGPNYNEERHELMENAFNTLDYSAWSELMTENGRHPRVVNVVTESNFETFVQAHDAGKNGDYEAASALRTELGLNNGISPKNGIGFGGKIGQGNGQGQRMQHNDFIDADNDGNYDNIGLRQGKGRR